MSTWPWKKGFKSITEVLCESQVTFGKAVLSFNKSSTPSSIPIQYNKFGSSYEKFVIWPKALNFLTVLLVFQFFQEILVKVRMKSGKGLHSETCEYDCMWLRTPWEKQFLWYIHCNSFMVVVFSYVYQVCFRQYSPHAVHLLTQKILYPPHHNFAQASRFFVHFLAGTAWLPCKIS